MTAKSTSAYATVALTGRRRGSTAIMAAIGMRLMSCATLAVAPGGVPFFVATM